MRWQAHGGFLYAFNSVAVRPWPLESKDPKFNLGDREKTLDAALLRQIDEYNLLHQEEPEPKELTLSDLTRHAAALCADPSLCVPLSDTPSRLLRVHWRSDGPMIREVLMLGGVAGCCNQDDLARRAEPCRRSGDSKLTISLESPEKVGQRGEEEGAWLIEGSGSLLHRIICTGHSLGGALATLAAVWSRVALKEHLPAEVRPYPQPDGICKTCPDTCLRLATPRNSTVDSNVACTMVREQQP